MCNLTQGRAAKPCKLTQGGTSILYLHENFIEDVFTFDPATGLATAINPLLTAGKVFEFKLDGDLSPFNEDGDGSRTSGKVVTQTVTAFLRNLDADTNATLNLLLQQFSQGVIKDRNDNYHAFGIDDGMDFSFTKTTGSSKSDVPSYTLTGTAETRDPAPLLDSTTITTYLTLVA